MRIFFSILLFTSFAIRPAIEISNVLYYQLNIDTIIKKYCVNKERPQLNCNGKCYLMTQMKMSKTSSDSDSDTKNTLTVIVEAFIPLFFENYVIKINENPLFLSKHQQHWKPDQVVIKRVSNIIDQPPEIYFS